MDIKHYQENLFSALLSKEEMENLGQEMFERLWLNTNLGVVQFSY